MSEYPLKIVTPDGLAFDGDAERLIARTIVGDVCILKNHADYVVPLNIGKIRVKSADTYRNASCSGGTLTVRDGVVTVIASTFEWSDEIDIERAKHAKEVAENRLKNKTSDYELRLAELKLKRALNRINISSGK